MGVAPPCIPYGYTCDSSRKPGPVFKTKCCFQCLKTSQCLIKHGEQSSTSLSVTQEHLVTLWLSCVLVQCSHLERNFLLSDNFSFLKKMSRKGSKQWSSLLGNNARMVGSLIFKSGRTALMHCGALVRISSHKCLYQK